MAEAVEAAIRKGATVVLIAGATASGKSRFAFDLAARHRGVVVNADSMQVYRELRILTARPSDQDEAAVPHRLYGHVPAAERYSVGRWLDDLRRALAEARQKRMLPIVVGGTGLYFKALLDGLVEVPPIPAEVGDRVRAEAEGETSPTLHARLAAVDPEDAAGIRPSDRTRILRALEVFEATGRSLLAWQQRPAVPVVDRASAAAFVMDVERAELHERIAVRAEQMIREGALEEVRALLALKLSPDLPAMKAIGVAELGAHLRGAVSIEEALAGIRTETRRYAKRQLTWFRHQTADWPRLAP